MPLPEDDELIKTFPANRTDKRLDAGDPADEVVIVSEGEMDFELESGVHHLQAGQQQFIPAEVIHSARNIGRATARWLFKYRNGAGE